MAKLSNLIDEYAKQMVLCGEAWLRWKDDSKTYDNVRNYHRRLDRLQVVAYALRDLGLEVEGFKKFQQ